MATDLDDTAEMESPGTVQLRAMTTGRVVRDERGNAVWKWARAFGELRRLENPGLTVVDGQPQDPASGQPRSVGGKSGYNPYESGLIEKQARARKRDLRKLSQAIEQRRIVKKDSAE